MQCRARSQENENTIVIAVIIMSSNRIRQAPTYTHIYTVKNRAEPAASEI